MIRSYRALPFLLLAACGTASTPEADPAVAQHERADEPSLERSVEEATGEQDREEATEQETEASAETEGVAAAAESGDCTTSFDCTIALDTCGRPYAVPRTFTVDLLAGPTPCPPAGYAPVEPRCVEGRCEAGAVYRADLRTCQADRECVVIEAPCNGWFAVRRGHQAAALRQLEEDVREGGCPVGAARQPRPRAACLANTCATRAP